MNCKHGAIITDPSNFIITSPDAELVSCECCGAALRLKNIYTEQKEPQYCNICSSMEDPVLCISVGDQASLKEGM